ncbi:mechanosensitive ion channel family protein [Kocuria rhizophila]|uniref:mechanosensitive ion channel family protein n=1 Tax=Kocuria rhizophila TaxID=72000 RepID=UPI000750110E|nr:mechanosensitive ion channel family protein [Kocuria rhizophila]KUP28124.1 mechanosensitive ion channel protein MscS [Kocuria rhizophila]MCT1916467.1 mechanosensitive ion channel family protein [Kocuria rhizophila]
MHNLEFWLDKPVRVLAVLLGAVIVSALVRLVIRKVTRGIARGTQSRIVKRFDHGQARWVQDAGIASERQALRAKTIGAVLSSVSTIVVWAIATLMVISELGYDIAPVLASAGIAGVALSFGAQSLVKDYLSGIFMVAEDQLGIGDSVDLGEAIGTVENVGLRVTQVRDVKGTLWHVRNGEILRVGNQSQGWARCVLDIPVPYDTNIDLVADMIEHEALLVRDDPDVGPSIVDDPEVWGVENISGESITIRLAVKTAPLEQWDVARVMRVRIKKMLDRDGLRIPLTNQVTVRTGSEPETSADMPTTSFPVPRVPTTGQVRTTPLHPHGSAADSHTPDGRTPSREETGEGTTSSERRGDG